MAKPKRATIDQSEIAPVNTNMFANTGAASAAASTPTPDKPESRTPTGKTRKNNPVVAISVALRREEYREFDQIAEQLQPWPVKRMAVMNEALRYFLQEHKAGRIKLQSAVKDARVVVEIVS